MRRLFILLSAALCLLAAGTRASAQVPILYYDFENNTTRTAFSNAVEQSVNSGSGALTRSDIDSIGGTTGAGTYNGGAAVGQAISTNGWQTGASDPGTAATDYFQLVVNTTGFSQISVTFDNQASNTGPAAVGLMYSTDDGASFTSVSPVPTGNNAFSTAVFDLSGVPAVDNQATLTIRIYAYAGNAGDRTGRGVFGPSGTFRIDNLTVRARTFTASKTLLDYPAVGLSTKSGTAFVPAYTDLFVNGSGINVTLGGELKLLGTLNVTSGTLDQGAASNLTAGTVSVAAGGTLKNQGVGDLTVGAGGVANDGTINFDGGGPACTDDILIRSTINDVQRTWSGAGAFSFIDVDVKDQKAAGVPTFPVLIIAASSKDSGDNANWTFTSDPTCASGAYTWVGGTGNDWQSPASWSPARLVPNASDVLIFDGGVTPAPAVNNVPTQTIATLKLINAAAVTLNASTLAASQTLTMAGAQALLVPSASTITLSGGNALRLNVAGGATATIGGAVAFEGAAHRLLGNAPSAVTFQSGSLFNTDTGFSGNPFGTGAAAGDGAANSVVFAGGSNYLHLAGESPFGGAGNGAVAVFQTGSTATWLTSSGFQANGRAYADLVVGKEDPGGVAVNLSDTGAGDFQFDNLTIASPTGSNSSLQFTGTGASTVNVRGNVTSKGAGLGSIPDVTLGGGTGGVVISRPGGGAVTFTAAGNTRALDFESSAKVAAGTTLTLGRVLVAGLNASNNFVVTVEGALEGSAGGYVIGKLRRQLSGTGASVFQVGSANGYSPVTLGVTSNSNGSPAPFTVSAAASYMTGVVSQSKSVKRTYTITSGAPEGSITADVTFQYVPSPTTSGGDVSADVVESTLNAFRREAGDALAEFAASARGVNTVTVGGVNSFSEWTLANARPCALTVNTTADPSGASGTVSLREALRDVCAGGTVNFDLPADSVITLASELALTRNVRIAGPSNRLTVSGGGAARVFNVNSGASAYVSNLNVTGGAAPSGGAVQNSGTLALVGVSLFGNNATGDGGGAVRNDGTLNLVNSTLSGNNAAPAASDGGALLVAAGKTATLLNTTVTGNTAGRDGNGIHNSGTLILKNSVVAGNGSAGVDLFDAGTTTQGNSITSGTPGLSALAYRGGPTKTHVPLPGGAAVNAGTDATTLDGPIDDTQTTVNVADAAAVPPGLLIRVDDEQMLVTAKSAGVLTVTRGANGSKAAAHSGGAAVNPAFDQRGGPRLAGSAPDIGAAEAVYAVSATAGTPQSATIGTAFVTPFKAAVTESGDPVGGLSLSFAAPAAGASGTFQTTGTNAATVTTDPGGVATAPAFSANGVAGGYSVTAGLAGGSPSAGFGLTNLKLDQTIAFNVLSNKTFGDADFQLSASASSNLGVTFAASGDCTISGSTAHLTGAGTCTVTASQAGDASYNAAPDVDRSFSIAKAVSTTTVNASNGTYDGQPHGATAGVSGAGGLGQNLTVVTYAGRNVTNYPASPVAPTNAGEYTASATFAGDDNHTGSDDSKNFTIAKAPSAVTVTCPAGVTYDGSAQTPCSAGVAGAGGLSRTRPVSYTNNVNVGTATASASYDGDDNHAAGSDSEDFRIGKAAQVITLDALPDRTFGDADFTPGAAASSGLGVTFAASGPCSVSGSRVHITGAGVCTVTASQAGGENYNAALDVQRSFQIAKAATATALSSAPNPSGASRPVTLTAAVTSAAGTPTGTVTFKDGGAAVAGCESKALSSGQVTCATSALGAGGHALTAEYSGDSDFNASAGSLSGAQTVGGAFEFSRSSYTAAERGGFVTVTVRRTGDTGAAASVDYSTDDGSVPAFAVACSAATGQASERCDYTRASGTLRYGPGEAEKTFVVLVNDDSFVEGTETTRLRLSNPSDGALLGGQSSAVLEIGDDTTETAVNVIDDDEDFVREHYHDFLNREADAEGLKFWTDGIRACGADAGCREVKRVHTSAAFFLSIEFQETGYFAYRVHKAAFGDLTNKPVPLALKDFLRDTQRLGGGVVVGQGDWRRQLDENKAAFAVEFVRRPEFLTRHPEVMNPTDFVNALDADAGGVLDVAEKAALVSELSTSPSDAALRASVLMKVADNPALARREKNRAFVLMQYVGYLRRNPDDAPEEKLDFTGYGFWLSKLEQFDGDFVGAEMVKAFINSVEYRGRFGR